MRVGVHDLVDGFLHLVPLCKFPTNLGTTDMFRRLEQAEECCIMDRVSRCIHCGKHLTPIPSESGRTELQRVSCDKLDPMALPTSRQWADSPLAQPTCEAIS
jgi:hypothetical protein